MMLNFICGQLVIFMVIFVNDYCDVVFTRGERAKKGNTFQKNVYVPSLSFSLSLNTSLLKLSVKIFFFFSLFLFFSRCVMMCCHRFFVFFSFSFSLSLSLAEMLIFNLISLVC